MDELKATVFKQGEDLDQVKSQVEELANSVKKVVNAFPNGDHDGHRRFHETQMEMLEEKRRLRIAIQEKTISGLIWAAIVIGCKLLWDGVVKAMNVS